jgi:hypothetical protein
MNISIFYGLKSNQTAQQYLSRLIQEIGCFFDELTLEVASLNKTRLDKLVNQVVRLRSQLNYLSL